MQVLWLRFLNVISYLKEPGLLTEKADSRSGAGDIQGEPGTFLPARNQGLLRTTEVVSERLKSQSEEAKRWGQFEYQ